MHAQWGNVTNRSCRRVNLFLNLLNLVGNSDVLRLSTYEDTSLIFISDQVKCALMCFDGCVNSKSVQEKCGLRLTDCLDITIVVHCDVK